MRPLWCENCQPRREDLSQRSMDFSPHLSRCPSAPGVTSALCTSSPPPQGRASPSGPWIPRAARGGARTPARAFQGPLLPASHDSVPAVLTWAARTQRPGQGDGGGSKSKQAVCCRCVTAAVTALRLRSGPQGNRVKNGGGPLLEALHQDEQVKHTPLLLKLPLCYACRLNS